MLLYLQVSSQCEDATSVSHALSGDCLSQRKVWQLLAVVPSFNSLQSPSSSTAAPPILLTLIDQLLISLPFALPLELWLEEAHIWYTTLALGCCRCEYGSCRCRLRSCCGRTGEAALPLLSIGLFLTQAVASRRWAIAGNARLGPTLHTHDSGPAPARYSQCAGLLGG